MLIPPNGGYLTVRGARSAGVVLVPNVLVGQEFCCVYPVGITPKLLFG